MAPSRVLLVCFFACIYVLHSVQSMPFIPDAEDDENENEINSGKFEDDFEEAPNEEELLIVPDSKNENDFSKESDEVDSKDLEEEELELEEKDKEIEAEEEEVHKEIAEVDKELADVGKEISEVDKEIAEEEESAQDDVGVKFPVFEDESKDEEEVSDEKDIEEMDSEEAGDPYGEEEKPGILRRWYQKAKSFFTDFGK